MTVLTEIPLEFESYLRDKTLQKLPTNLNEFIFAYIPNLDLSVDIDRNSTIPSESLIVHKAPVASIGKTGENAIVYSAIIDSTVNEFTFNAIYLHDRNEANACGMIIHQQDETKQQAMTITKSALMQYDSAAASANVTIDAETWQVDISDLFAACSKIGHTHTLKDVGGSNPNLFINGNFSIWQRGTDFAASSKNYTADRWWGYQVGAYRGTYENPSDGHFIEIRSSADFGGELIQPIERIFKKGQVLTASFFIRVKSGDPSNINVFCRTVQAGGKTSTLWSSEITSEQVQDYELSVITVKLTKTLDETDTDAKTEVGLKIGTNAVVDVYWAKCEEGDIATAFVPDLPSVNLAKCQRYFYKTDTQYMLYGILPNFVARNVQLEHKVSMRAVPAITLGKLVNAGNIHYRLSTVNGVRVESLNVPDPTAYSAFLGYTADAEI